MNVRNPIRKSYGYEGFSAVLNTQILTWVDLIIVWGSCRGRPIDRAFHSSYAPDTAHDIFGVPYSPNFYFVFLIRECHFLHFYK